MSKLSPGHKQAMRLIVALASVAVLVSMAPAAYKTSAEASEETRDWERRQADCVATPSCDYGQFLKEKAAAEPNGDKAFLGVVLTIGVPMIALFWVWLTGKQPYFARRKEPPTEAPATPPPTPKR